MNWLKHNPRLGAALLGCLAAMAGEAWLLHREWQRAGRAVAVLEQKKQERDWLARQSPALTEANERAIAHDLARAQEVLASLRTALQGREGATLAAPPPAKSIDAYFDIAAFVEKTRALAARAQVSIRADERFGFASHANEGPETELVPAVFHQRLTGQYIVEALLESRPRALLMVQRERPLTATQRATRNQPAPAGANSGAVPAGHDGQPGDFFVIDRQLSLREPGRVDSVAFRLEFTGQTPALREFLSNLAAFKLPVIVRSVEVEPMTAEVPPPVPATPLPAGSPLPLVARNFSRFSVLVEFVDCIALPGRPAS